MTTHDSNVWADQDKVKAARAEEAHLLAKGYFAYLVATYGDEVAREVWKAAPPSRRKGFRNTDVKRRQDRFLLAMDQTQQEMGMTAIGSAEYLADMLQAEGGPNAEVHADSLRRTLDRSNAKLAKSDI